MKQRAEAQERTRRRITEAAVELHGTVGPAQTSISALAQRAGVRRSTVYRHFPDEASIFAACSAHFVAQHPYPDPGAWAQVSDPAERVRTALGELYPHYGRVATMMDNLLRDAPLVPVVDAQLAGFRGYLEACAEVLMAGRRLRGRAHRRTRAAIGHALSFPAWRSLVLEQGLDADEAAGLMADLVDAAA
ncbi:MAG TPA: helix-turn-helix domain-containing protein [Solirubrobacteraceae bacterium]|nr:helix-turn-helix domain-containing protein [Solirubrobacteraceae bacterium]